MAKHLYEVIVGNIGNVYTGNQLKEALKHYAGYVEQSKRGYGRAGNESVCIMKDSDIHLEYDPRFPRELTWQDIFDEIMKMPLQQRLQPAMFQVPDEEGDVLPAKGVYYADMFKLVAPEPKLHLATTDNF